MVEELSTKVETLSVLAPIRSLANTLQPLLHSGSRSSSLHLSLPLPNLWPRLTLIRLHTMQHNLIRQLRRIHRVPFTPIITDGICKYSPTLVKRCSTNGPSNLRIPFQTMLRILVPEVECTVATCGTEGAVHGVETYCIDAVDVADIPRCWGGLAVAFEAEVGGRVFVLDVLNGAAPLYRAHSKARGVCEAGYDSGLPFEWRLERLVYLIRLIQIHNVYVTIRGADDKELVAGVHAVDAFLALECCGRGWGARVPVFDRLVPGAGDEKLGLLIWNVDEAGAADGLVVHGYLALLICVEVNHTRGFVCAGADDAGAVLARSVGGG